MFVYIGSIVIMTYVIYILGLAVYNLTMHRLAKFPGPLLHRAFYLPDLCSIFAGTSTADIHGLHKQYGSVVRITPEALSFNSALAWKDIYGLKDGKREMERDQKWHLDHAGETNIIVANTADHNRMRKLLLHAFSDTALQEQEPIVSTYFSLLISKLKEQIENDAGTAIDLTQWYNFTTFDIIGDLCMGEPFNTLSNGRYHTWISEILRGLKFVSIIRFTQTYSVINLLWIIILKLVPQIQKAQKAHMDFTIAKIDKRLSAETDRKDFITYILRNNDEKGMSREEIEGTSTVMIMAGSETTASFLCGATYYILSNSAIYQKLQAEVRGAFSSESEITLASSRRLTYLTLVIKEALRIYPPTPSLLPRRTRSQGDIIDGHFIPGNVSVGVHHWSASHSYDNFTAPESFDPERWSTPTPEKYRNDIKDASQPFSMGPRSCLGMNLAYFEMRSILARIIWNFDMSLSVQSREWAHAQKAYILWDKPPLLVNLSVRK